MSEPSAPPPVWVQRLFHLNLSEGCWTIELDREDVNNVLDHLQLRANQGDLNEIANGFGLFLLQQMLAFRSAHDILCLQELAREVWGKQT